MEGYLTPEELAERWKGVIMIRTLAVWRSRGTGPEFVKFGRKVMYPIHSVVSFETKNIVKGGE